MITTHRLQPGIPTCPLCKGRMVAEIFTDGDKAPYVTWRRTLFQRPVFRGLHCQPCDYSEAKPVLFRKVEDKPEIRQNIVTGIRRLKERGWTLFDGDARWS